MAWLCYLFYLHCSLPSCFIFTAHCFPVLPHCSLPMHVFASVCIYATWTCNYAWPLLYVKAPSYICLLCIFIWDVFAPHKDTSGLLSHYLVLQEDISLCSVCMCLPSMHMHSPVLLWLTPAYACVCATIYCEPYVIYVCFIHTCGGDLIYPLSCAINWFASLSVCYMCQGSQVPP